MSDPRCRAAAVVIVTYRSNNVLDSCLKSIPDECEVVVVDQPTDEDPAVVVNAVRPGARIVRPMTNRGFGAGCNLGAAVTTREIVIFLNPDASLGAGSVETLVDAVRRHGGTAVAPRMTDPLGQDITMCPRLTRVRRDLVSMVVPKMLQPGSLQRDLPTNDPAYRRGGPVPCIHGACMAVSKQMFRDIGGFNEDFFLYYEEEWLALALAKRGLAPRLDITASFTHLGRSSTDPIAAFAVEEQFRSRAMLYRSSFHPLVAYAGLLSTAAILLLLLPTHGLRALLRYRPSWTAAWCRAAIRGLARGSLVSPTVAPPPRSMANGR